MTTSVIIKTNHGWPVDVTCIDAKSGARVGEVKRIPKDSEDTIYVHSGVDLRIHEVQPDEGQSNHAASPIMKHFAYAHLPAHLQAVSKPFGDLARHMDETLPSGPEKSAGLRKLLEAKDCLVRAALDQ